MKRIIVGLMVFSMLFIAVMPANAGGYGRHYHGGHYRHYLGGHSGDALAALLVLGGVVVAASAIEAATRPDVVYVQPAPVNYRPTCGSVYDCEYQKEAARWERQKQTEYERIERERARNDARRRYGY